MFGNGKQLEGVAAVMMPQRHSAAPVVAHAERLLSQELDRLDTLQAQPPLLHTSCLSHQTLFPAESHRYM